MNYKQYLKQENLLDGLLFKLGVLKKEQLIIKVDISPDPDVVPTDWRVDDNNYFKNYWSFSEQFASVSEIKFTKNRVYHFDDIKAAESEFELSLNGDAIDFSLNIIDQLDSSYFSINGTDQHVNESFNFHRVRLLSIDNEKRKVWYDGSFLGSHDSYFQNDWGVFSKIAVAGIPIALKSFYLELIGESYLLYKNGKYKLSYFIAYSALENYVNTGLGSEETEERLIDKLKYYLKEQAGNLLKHEIFNSIIDIFSGYTINRNNIAHGKGAIEVGEQHAQEALVFVGTLICAFNNNISTFKELSESVN